MKNLKNVNNKKLTLSGITITKGGTSTWRKVDNKKTGKYDASKDVNSILYWI